MFLSLLNCFSTYLLGFSKTNYKNALNTVKGFLFFSLFVACVSDIDSTTAPPPLPEADFDLEIVVNSGRLRKAPSPSAPILLELAKGTALHDLNQVSNHTTQISFGEEQFDEPWLLVRTADSIEGWIYARDIANWGKKMASPQLRHRKHLQSIFGSAGMDRLAEHRHAWESVNSATHLSNVYEKGLVLRDTFIPQLEKKSYQYNGIELPDLFWIESYIPGMVPQLVAEGTVYYLFFDYRAWLEKAKATTGQEDDRFFQLMVKCFPQDSIEYFFPAWELQTWDYGGHNLLGRGLAYDIFSDLAQFQQETALFSEPIESLKDQFLEDVTRDNIHFWEPDSLVIPELDSIIQANWSIFTPTDLIALKTRRIQLDSAEVHGINFNARAGGH
ncbi:MAG: SH3 domain-containing protein [Saprospiraceae bacterium]|nr:SH3 domain-containing protein [Saprospiraceae bacterium]